MNGYVPKRRGVIEHLRTGRMSAQMYAAHDVLLLLAEKSTGIWWGSAKALASQFGYGDISNRQARHILEDLASGGYIKRFAVERSHRNYPILINRYLVTSGAHSGMILNAAATTDWHHPVYALCPEHGPERGPERAPIREVRRIIEKDTMESAYADTQLSASEVAAREPKLAACAAPRQRRAHWPEGFSLTDKLRGYALEHGIAASEIDTEWEHFENHHQAKGTRFMDWNRAWYTWVLNHKQFAKGARHGETADERRRREADEQTARVVASIQAKRSG